MKKSLISSIPILLLVISSCQESDNNLFEKSAADRAADAIASLKAELTTPANGWRLRYTPVSDAGSFYVLMDFNDDNTVRIKSDLGANEGEFFDKTITYRIDNSLGLELIIETYSIFGYLFELDQATFGAEYEFNYANKTPEGALVFTSKTDQGEDKTTLVFEQAGSNDENLLGRKVATDFYAFEDDLDIFSTSFALTYDERDLVLYLSIDQLKRTVYISAAALKSDPAQRQFFNFASGYIIEGDALVFDSPFSANTLGNSINLSSINFNNLGEGAITLCAEPININTYTGVTSNGDAVTLATSLINAGGASFASTSDFYFNPLVYIFDNGVSVENEIKQDIAGALEMHLYYGLELNDGTLLYGIGFVIENNDGSITIALREFTPELVNNNIVFNFKEGFRLFLTEQTDANLENINKYLNALSEGNNTYVLRYSEDIYEFVNPCTGWSFVFLNAD